ncbi:hypothetical protein GYB29_15900 [bacterium]|jgi:hypothetical protein|nr:hypothetical protein [bacterium]
MSRTKEQTTNTLLANFESFNNALNNIEALKDEHPELYEEQLLRISESYKTLLTSDTFFVDMILGIQRFKDRAIRKSARKPLNINKFRSLNNDLKDISRILKV